MPIPTQPADPLKTPTKDTPTTSSTEPAEPTEPEAPVEEPTSAEPEEAPKPTILQRAQALVKSKPVIQAEASNFKKQLGEAQEQLAQAEATIISLTEEKEALSAENVAIGKVVTQLEEQEKTVTQKATSVVAATGLPPEELPAQETEGDEPNSVAGLEKQIEATDDPVEQGRLAKAIRELRK